MGITKGADGSLFLIDDNTPARTQTVPPGSAATQNAAVVAFFALMAAPMFNNPFALQTVQVATDASGVAAVNWANPFPVPPIPVGCIVFDASGAIYAHTLIGNSATAISYQIKKQRALPSSLALLSALVSYDTYQPAPAGVTVFLSAKVPTQ